MSKMEWLNNQNDLSCTESSLILKKPQYTINFKRQFYRPTQFSFMISMGHTFLQLLNMKKITWSNVT